MLFVRPIGRMRERKPSDGLNLVLGTFAMNIKVVQAGCDRTSLIAPNNGGAHVRSQPSYIPQTLRDSANASPSEIADDTARRTFSRLPVRATRETRDGRNPPR